MTDRKARLAALAARAGRITKATEDEEPKIQESEAVMQVDSEEPAAKRIRGDDDGATGSVAAVDDNSKALELALSKAQAEASMSDADALIAAAPKKINWDLKRDIQPKLDKLERRTQKAIVQILRTRLEQQAEAET